MIETSIEDTPQSMRTSPRTRADLLLIACQLIFFSSMIADYKTHVSVVELLLGMVLKCSSSATFDPSSGQRLISFTNILPDGSSIGGLFSNVEVS